ncbi:uncharacterized protein LOC143045237 isoform X1 [Mytilus galloprovincialis]|uniref:Transcription cofactor vestigial-like protein 4 n=3 Tax=Mytilus TaxID=6548 RepID=A0A8B6GCH5_MYTGA|nr:unnamed protein product [Mytilus edulis]VDI62011.1 Hypothetical predicted protein [Mytilus galloprovincialis]
MKFGSNNTMSVLGESHFGYSEFRSGFFSSGLPSGGSLPFGSGLGYTSLSGPPVPSVPLWRPTPSLPIPQYCMDIRCPCNLSRSFGTNVLDYVPSFLPPWYLKLAGDHLLYKGQTSLHESQESPTSKELPTKIQKQERLKERQGLPQTLNFDKDRESKFLSKSRCTGTQTQISSADPELPMYLNGARSDQLTVDQYAAAHQAMLIQANQLMRERGSPPRYSSLDSHDTPLNLSLSNSTLASQNSSYSTHVPRPSVITCAPNVVDRGQQSLSPSISPQSLPSPSRREVRTELCDPAIEEHFRRSLGRDYSDFVSSKSSPKTPSLPSPSGPPPQLPSPPVENKTQIATNVSITGSVDDHFAKSLGNSTWTALKAKKDPVNELFTGSVDDHFAKALGGDTWLRIKAEKENGHCTSLSQQRHDSSLLSTQH